jgi:WD40 repeat protein
MCQFDPEGKSLVVGTTTQSFLWDLSSDAPQQLEQSQIGRPTACAFSSDGRLIAITVENHATLYDRADGSIRRQLRGHTEVIQSVTFSPDGKLIATGSDDLTVRIWHRAVGQEMLTLEGHQYGVHGVRFSNDGDALFSFGLGFQPGSGNRLVQSVLCWPASPMDSGPASLGDAELPR